MPVIMQRSSSAWVVHGGSWNNFFMFYVLAAVTWKSWTFFPRAVSGSHLQWCSWSRVRKLLEEFLNLEVDSRDARRSSHLESGQYFLSSLCDFCVFRTCPGCSGQVPIFEASSAHSLECSRVLGVPESPEFYS